MRQSAILVTMAEALVLLLATCPLVASEAPPSSGCGKAPPARPGESSTLSMKVGDLERQYRLHLPRGYDQNVTTSLVLVFHGYTRTAEQTEIESTLMSSHADENGYIVVYPQATSFVAPSGATITSWNDLSCNASPGPEGPICSPHAVKYPHPPECGEAKGCNWCTCHDDLAFVGRLLDELGDTLCIDLDRVHATGISNGGMFVHRLGCDMPDRFAAIAPVAGTLARGFNCAPDRSTPISILNIYGSRDRYVALDGSESSDGYFYTSAADVMDAWANAASQACSGGEKPYPTSADGIERLSCTERADCATGAEVVNCSWEVGHVWPRTEDRHFGNDIIWEFFRKNGRKDILTRAGS